MCLAKAYVGGDDEKGLLMEEVTSLKVEDGKLLVTTLFGEQQEITAKIREIDFKASKIFLEK